jgi:hypothetical protein
MNGIMNRKLREKAGFAQSLHNFTKRGIDLGYQKMPQNFTVPGGVRAV